MLWYTQLRLKSNDPAVRRRAILPLTYTAHPEAFRLLTKALEDTDAEVRKLAAEALGLLEGDAKSKTLVAVLRDRDPEVLQAALAGLKKLIGPDAVTAVMNLLRHPDSGVRAMAAQTLRNNKWQPADKDQEIWLYVAAGQFIRAATFGSAAVSALEQVLSSATYSLSLVIINALGGISGPTVMRPLLAALRAPEVSVCMAAVDAIRRVGDKEAIPHISGLLHHSYGQLRVTAIEALGEFGAESELEQIRPMLRDPLWDVRRAAAYTLGKLRDMPSLQGLLKGLNDPDEDVREECARALGSLGSAEAIRPLVLALRDSTSSMRRISVAALSRIDEDWTSTADARSAAEELKTHFSELETDVRFFVHNLLLGMAASKEALELEKKPVASDSDAISSANKRRLAVSLFFGLLTDLDRDLRQAAAEALGRIGDSRAVTSLTRVLGDADPDVRMAAEQSLRALGARAS